MSIEKRDPEGYGWKLQYDDITAKTWLIIGDHTKLILPEELAEIIYSNWIDKSEVEARKTQSVAGLKNQIAELFTSNFSGYYSEGILRKLYRKEQDQPLIDSCAASLVSEGILKVDARGLYKKITK